MKLKTKWSSENSLYRSLSNCAKRRMSARWDSHWDCELQWSADFRSYRRCHLRWRHQKSP